MHAMHEIEIVLGLLVAVAALAPLARRLGLPYPILLVLGGLALGAVPGLPRVELAPELVAYRMAVAGAVTGAFSIGEASLRFAMAGTGGVLIGLLVGWFNIWLRR